MPNPSFRSLTPGEIDIARSIFGTSIDYSNVALVRKKWWPLQPRNVAMAPTGNIHVHPKSDLWSRDFSKEPLPVQGFFIHEMTHVWQSQSRGRFYLPLMRHPFCRYRYTVIAGRPFGRYGIEQQAEIVRHTFLLRHGWHLAGSPKLSELNSILPFATVTGKMASSG